MASEFVVVNNMRGHLVQLGLGRPLARAFVASTAAAAVVYMSGYPQAAFREDGTLKAFKPLSAEPDATYTHFLMVPLIVGVSAYLFT